MNRRSGLVVAGVGLAILTGSFAWASMQEGKAPAQPEKKVAPSGQPELPPGMTPEDMQSCMEAAIPGPMHQWLVEGAGVWVGQTKMWMAPGTEPQISECVSTVTPMLEGRFVRCEITGDMPGMGPFNGFGIYGFDNVSQKFQSTWIDNMGTGMMNGIGDLSSDGKTLSWTFTYNCPITKKPTIMREVERRTGKNTSTLEMFGTPPTGGEEYKMMEITFTRKPGGAPVTGTR